MMVCWVFDWLCWGLTTRQPLWFILCHLPEKGRNEIVEEMKGRDREEREQEWNWRNRRNKKKPPPPPLPLPAKGLQALPNCKPVSVGRPSDWLKIHHTFATPDHHLVCWVYSLELPWWGNSNEYTQHTFSWQVRKFHWNIPKYLFS